MSNTGDKQLPYTIAVTGGKGGTGKTLVAISLATYFSIFGKNVLLMDCDVDSPNISLLLNVKLSNKQEVKVFFPSFNPDKCSYCGKCSEVCPEKAILSVKNKLPIVFPKICTGCEACKIVCPEDAINDDYKTVGWTYEAKIGRINIVSGELKINEVNSTEVVKAVRRRSFNKIKNSKIDVVIIDTAPGAHCDVVRALNGANIAIAVTEPTFFGLHDLELILKLLNMMNLNSFVIINRYDMVHNFDYIDNIVKNYSSSIIGRIPYDTKILQKYVEKELFNLSPDISEGFKALQEISLKLLNQIEQKIEPRS
ncbi:MAG: nucleotide-binding protein [Candidatus Odinarchaeia archaeon]